MPKRKLPMGGKPPAPSGGRAKRSGAPLLTNGMARAGRAPSSSTSTSTGKKKAGPLAFDLVGGDRIDDTSVEEHEEGAPEATEEEQALEERETAEEKRVRMAKSYLEHIGQQEEDTESSSDEDEDEDEGVTVGDRLGARLEKERLKVTGQLRREVAFSIGAVSESLKISRVLQAHRLPVTCLALAPSGKHAYSGSKDNSVVQWDLESGKATFLHPRWNRQSPHKAHEKEILALALSSDGRYLASGSRAKDIMVWDTRSNALLKTFTGHRDAVSALAFRVGTHALYSGSCDRCVKHWNLDDMAYVETLFGHQSEITGIDAFRKERAVTVGRDRTVRLWKIPEDSQLVYKGGHQDSNSIDCVAFLSEEAFVTGGDDGSLSLWHVDKKKPVVVVPQAHGPSSPWIVSVAALASSDLVISGSSDGFLRFWKAALHPPALEQVAAVPVAGFINAIKVSSSARLVVVGVGQEHRLGRWERIKAGKNGIHLIPLPAVEEAS